MKATVSYLFMLPKYINSKEAQNFSIDFNDIDTNDILDINKYLMKKKYKIMF